jgi:beta-mannanase
MNNINMTGKVGGFSRYTICRNGNVVNDNTNTVLKGTIANKGYRRYTLQTDEGKKQNMLGHRLVALAFLPNPEKKQMIDHVDRNKTNNHISNLRWATNSENQINTGLCKRKIEGDGYRHIRRRTIKGTEYYHVQIVRNGKHIVSKMYKTNKYTIDQVVKLRNEFYKIHDIAIQDE